MGGTDMPTSDDFFEATGILDFDGEGNPGVGFLTGSDENNAPRFNFGGMMVGSIAGLWGQAGGGDIFENRVAGLVGTSPEGAPGVFGQSEATSTAPITLTAGVLGSADTSA